MKYTSQQESLIRQRYPKEGASQLASEFNVNIDALTAKAMRMGVRCESRANLTSKGRRNKRDFSKFKPHPSLNTNDNKLWQQWMNLLKNGMSMDEIGELNNVSTSVISCFLRGLTRHSLWLSRKDLPDDFTQEQKEMNDGNMLGDGHIRILDSQAANTCFTIGQSVAHLEYLKSLFNLYGNFSSSICSNNGYRNGVYHEGYNLNTKRHSVFVDRRKKWYRDPYISGSQKIVPTDIVLTWRTAAFWAVDDGYTKNNSRQFCLASQSFSKEDNESLKFYLERDLGINAVVCKNNELAMYGLQAVKFIEGIRPYVIWDCFQYKLIYSAKQKWRDIPNITKRPNDGYSVQCSIPNGNKKHIYFGTWYSYWEAAFVSITIGQLVAKVLTKQLSWEPSLSLIPIEFLPSKEWQDETKSKILNKLQKVIKLG